MTLKAKLDTLDGVDPVLAKEYKKVEHDGVTEFLLDAEGVEDVTGLKSALSKERTAAQRLSKALKKLGLKDDEASVNTLMEKLGDKTVEEVIEELGAKPGETTEAVTKALKPLQRQLSERDEAIASQGSFIDRLVRENQLKDVLALPDVDGNPVLLLPHLLKETKVVEEDGADGKEYVAKVVDPKTKEVRTKGGKEMSLKDLCLEYKDKPEFEGAWYGTGASGSGARQSQREVTEGSGGRKVSKDAVGEKRKTGSYNAI
jgi:ribosomal protein L12E/L44/L45/RPP1/RPP2